MKLLICAALIAMLGGCAYYADHGHGYGHDRGGHAGYYDRDGHYHDYDRDHDRDHNRGSYGY